MRKFNFSLPGRRSIVGAAIGSLAIAAMALLGTGCGGGDGGGCGVDAQKRFVLSVVEDWYLFQDLLPSSVNLNDYATADDLLDALTANARAQDKDRFFSFLTTDQAEQQFFGEGQAVAFGVGTELRAGSDSQHWRLFITKVEPQSPAAVAGFDRGDEILAIGTSPQDLISIDSLSGTQQQVAADVSQLFGPSQVGVQRSFRVQPRTGGSTVVRTMTKALITLDPVPIIQIIQRTGTTPIGYVALESFITPAEQQLRDAFSTFKANNVHDVIVDLRYNGGGLVSIAQTLASLLAQDHVGDPMFTFEFNSKHQDQNETEDFLSEPEGIAADRIAFITTDATASASELTINSLEPYADVAIIGGQTYGKPVGQGGFDMPDCDVVLRLIAFQTVNADGEGGYFTGLPDAEFSGDFCEVDDDLTQERGDPAEDSTGTAISWLNNGVCPSTGKALAKALFPRTERPTLVEDNQPGLF